MEDNSSPSGMGLRDAIGLGGLLVAAVVAGTGLGWVVDNQLQTGPVFTLIGLVAGIASAIVGSWVRVRHFLD